jgi:hypothetical protein
MIFLKDKFSSGFIFGFILLCMFFITSCTKEGLEGEFEIEAIPEHHEKPIYGSTIYIKFNQREFPGSLSSNYDHIVTGTATESHVHLPGLKKGDYFIYAVGYDSTISEIVKGGLHVHINKKHGHLDLKIPVTE